MFQTPAFYRSTQVVVRISQCVHPGLDVFLKIFYIKINSKYVKMREGFYLTEVTSPDFGPIRWCLMDPHKVVTPTAGQLRLVLPGLFKPFSNPMTAALFSTSALNIVGEFCSTPFFSFFALSSSLSLPHTLSICLSLSPSLSLHLCRDSGLPDLLVTGFLGQSHYYVNSC